MARQDDYLKTALRLPRRLHEQLAAAAADNSTSLNSEIIRRLESTFPKWGNGEEGKTLDYFVATASSTPLSAVFSPEEIARLAERMLEVARAEASPVEPTADTKTPSVKRVRRIRTSST